jgi:hypothetical protein
MPCFTYLSGDEWTKPTTDKELNEVLAEARLVTGLDWRIWEDVRTYKRWFRKPITKKYYELVLGVGNGEFQLINFHNPDSGTSINMRATAGPVCAYLYGVLSGIRFQIK